MHHIRPIDDVRVQHYGILYSIAHKMNLVFMLTFTPFLTDILQIIYTLRIESCRIYKTDKSSLKTQNMVLNIQI